MQGKQVRSVSDHIDVTNLTTKLFYCVMLDCLEAYNKAGANTYFTATALKKVKESTTIHKDIKKYIIEYHKPNVKPNMLAPFAKKALQAIHHNPNATNKKQQKLKLISAKICGSITVPWSKYVSTEENLLPSMLPLMYLSNVRRLHDEAKITVPNTDYVSSPFGRRKFGAKNKKIQIRGQKNTFADVSDLKDLEPRTRVDAVGRGYITLTDMVMKVFYDENEEDNSFKIEDIFNYPPPPPQPASNNTTVEEAEEVPHLAQAKASDKMDIDEGDDDGNKTPTNKRKAESDIDTKDKYSVTEFVTILDDMFTKSVADAEFDKCMRNVKWLPGMDKAKKKELKDNCLLAVKRIIHQEGTRMKMIPQKSNEAKKAKTSTKK